jgi:ribosomal protein S14
LRDEDREEVQMMMTVPENDGAERKKVQDLDQGRSRATVEKHFFVCRLQVHFHVENRLLL